jgi:hypothetical protein
MCLYRPASILNVANLLGQPAEGSRSNLHTADFDALGNLLAFVADDIRHDLGFAAEVRLWVEGDGDAGVGSDVARWGGGGGAEERKEGGGDELHLDGVVVCINHLLMCVEGGSIRSRC